jgi:leucyl aminopeptidase
MDFSIKAFDTKNTIASAKAGCIAVAVFENKKLSQAAMALDQGGEITAALKSGDITGKPGSTLLLRGAGGASAARVLLVGLGADEAVSEKSFASAIGATFKAFAQLGAADAIIALPLADVKERDLNWAIRCIVIAAHESEFRTDGQKSKKDPAPSGVRKVTLAVPAADAMAKTALAQAEAIANGMDLTKQLGNLSANVCTPTYLANTARKLAKDHKFDVEVLDRKQLEALKMGSFLSVTNGSNEPPKFIVLKHMGGKAKDAPVVLVGKGITFDTGGISIKPGPAMDEMKYDMCGAASVLGTFRAIGEMGLRLNVVGIIAACENMPSGHATKPGDIVTSMNGLTIEVLNTDAEGRLVLCDALTYAERFKPAAVVDIAGTAWKSGGAKGATGRPVPLLSTFLINRV